MSNRRTKACRNREDEVDKLVSKLQALLPASSSSCNKTRVCLLLFVSYLQNIIIVKLIYIGTIKKVPASKILKETCNYIKSLRTKGDDLGERLSQLLDSMENNGVDVNIVRDLLQQ